jgi:hypothetical protein
MTKIDAESTGQEPRDAVLEHLYAQFIGPAADANNQVAQIDSITSTVSIENINPDVPFVVREGDGTMLSAFLGGGIADDSPSKRFAIGLIYPASENNEAPPDGINNDQLLKSDLLGPMDPSEPGGRQAAEGNLEDTGPVLGESADATPNTRRKLRKQTSFGLSFLVGITTATIRCKLSAGGYRPYSLAVQTPTNKERVWVRHQIEQEFAISLELSRTTSSVSIGALSFTVLVTKSPGPTSDTHFVTIRLTNETKNLLNSHKDESVAFQTKLRVSLESGENTRSPFTPFPDELEGAPGLLFHHEPIFSRGHGTSVQWASDSNQVYELETSFMPSVKNSAVSSDPFHYPVNDLDRQTWLASTYMKPEQIEAWMPLLQAFGRQYLAWVHTLENTLTALPIQHRRTGEEHISGCQDAHERFERGLALLSERDDVLRAFCLTNQSFDVSRRTRGKLESGAKWRPFQLYFLVMNLMGISAPESEDRQLVDLIWLPTGGGKTEAYLAVAAFTIWMRRISGSGDGVSVFMRYTLRLLTAQQFQRAAKLICAMESIRKIIFTDGKPIRIGIWIGGDQLPNSHRDATEKLVKMEQSQDNGVAVNYFGITACPFCSEPIGITATKGAGAVSAGSAKRGRTFKHATDTPRNTIAGIRGKANRAGIELYCPSSSCLFNIGLPLLIVDEDIYDDPPDFLLATVDKIATTAWNPKARAIFGIDLNGDRARPSFDLVIQDELHLIAGPLGTAFAMYEPLVGLLGSHGATSGKPAHMPKIICSTATVSEYQRQILQLFGRSSSHLFPPPGFRHGETYFTTAFSGLDSQNEGTTYVGIYSPEFQSAQTAQAVALAATVSAGDVLTARGLVVDPWWTTVAFFNSLRELGYAVTLVETDVPDYLRVWAARNPQVKRGVMPLTKVELTSRIPSHEIPEKLRELETAYPNPSSSDICLASTMIEVGIDVDRLALMAVLGQPNSTARYIQVTGRVGRNWRKAPGVVVTVYGLGKARDISHYEHFQSYHRRLYADVTPTLLAPFIEPALVKFLSGTAAAYLRQTMPAEGISQKQSFSATAQDLDVWARTYLSRADEFGRLVQTSKHVESIRQQVESWNLESRPWAQEPYKSLNLDSPAVICRADDQDAVAFGNRVWRVPTSLRDVESNVSVVPSSHKKPILPLQTGGA